MAAFLLSKAVLPTSPYSSIALDNIRGGGKMDDDEELDNIIDIYWRCLKNGKTLNRCEEKANNS